MKKPKIVYYEDALNDDFAGTKIRHKPLPKKYKYVHKKNILWIAFSFILYYIVAIPLFWLTGKLIYGVQVKGRKNMRRLRAQPVFFYGNHTQICDAWNIQTFIAGPKRCYITADQDATSIPCIRGFVTMLGCLPVPEKPDEAVKFKEAIKYRIWQRAGIIIYPERHIWNYSTHIRPFPSDSFVYPAELGTAVVAVSCTYRARKVFKNLPPLITLHVSKPIYPDMSLSLPERKEDLRKKVYNFLLDHSSEDENVEYIAYRKKPAEKKEESK